LVTGIIVAALGFGGVVFTPIVESLISAFGSTEERGEFKTFMVLGIVFLVVCSVGSIFMKNPPDGYMSNPNGGAAASAAVPEKRNYSPSEVLRSPKFYLVAFTLLLACMGGQMMMGFAKPLAEAKGLTEAAAIGVLAITMFNSVGRLLWGMVSDRLGRKNTIMILLAGNAVLPLLVNAVQGYALFVLIAFIGFFYGGLLSNFPSLTADLFGAKHMSVNYGLVLLGFGAGAVVSLQIAGHFRNVAAEANDINLMLPAFIIASCCAAGGIVLMLILRAITKRQKNK
jgi:OFA family oxalate/formate antiporter-like MFS transporter